LPGIGEPAHGTSFDLITNCSTDEIGSIRVAQRESFAFRRVLKLRVPTVYVSHFTQLACDFVLLRCRLHYIQRDLRPEGDKHKIKAFLDRVFADVAGAPLGKGSDKRPRIMP